MAESISSIAAPQLVQDVPQDLIPLPSEGKIYPVGSPLHNAAGVMIKPMTAKEEDILTSRALIRSNRVVSTLLRSCIVDKTIDVDSMLSGDRNVLLIGIRISGYGSDYPVKIDCPSCSTENKKDIDLTALPIKRFPADLAITPGVNEFAFSLPVTKRRATFKLITGVEETEMLQLIDRGRKSGGAEELVTTRLKIQLLSIGDERDPQKLAQLIRTMPARDSRELRKYIDHITPGIELKAPFTCETCGHQGEVEVPLGTDFFWPET